MRATVLTWTPVRIVSLVPHATELLFALELDGEVVGVTHECDHPWDATELPKVTKNRLPAGQDAAGIDAAVKAQTLQGQSIYELDEDVLRALEPDLIVTQSLCTVCAVSHDDVEALARTLPSSPEVVALDPHTLGEALGDIRTVAGRTDRKEEGVDLVEELAARIDRVRLASRGMDRPRVLAIEWLDPLFVGGHWVPQMIELAGGMDFLGLPGEPSRQADWDEVRLAEPNTVILMQCGYDAARAAEEADDFAEQLSGLGAANLYATDANAYFSRPGPRLIDGIELLAHTLHPTLVPEPAAGAMIQLEI